MSADDRNRWKKENASAPGRDEESPARYASTRRQFLLQTTAALAATTWATTAHGGPRSKHPRGATQLAPSGAFGRYDALGPLLEFFTPAGKATD